MKIESTMANQNSNPPFKKKNKKVVLTMHQTKQLIIKNKITKRKKKMEGKRGSEPTRMSGNKQKQSIITSFSFNSDPVELSRK